MNKICGILFSAIRSAIFGSEVDVVAYQALSAEEWQQLFQMAARQGVAAIVYDVVAQLPKESQPPRRIKLQWALRVENIEKRYNLQKKTSAFLAKLWANKGLQTIVMKGLAIGTYYPIPAHRECGDLDCFLVKDGSTTSDGYEVANQICEQIGADVCRDYYKDATIKYRGLLVENHCFYLPVRDGRKVKELELHLENIALRGKTSYVPDTHLIVPSPDFNALFLSMHGLNHFLSEGIKIHHILDWALLLSIEQNNINWTEFYQWTDKMHLTRFADVLTTISVEYLGLHISNPVIHTTSPYVDRVLVDTLFKSDGLFNKGYSAWKSRFIQVHNKVSNAWKYHKIYQKSAILELMRSAFAFLLEKNPKL